MGRDRRNERTGEHWTKMHRATMETPAWRALSTTAQALYPWIKLEWGGPIANNNGKIGLSVRQAAAKLSVTPDTAAKAFRDLVGKGFLFIAEYGTLGCSGAAKTHLYEITELPLARGDKPVGRHLYREWKTNRDFPSGEIRKNNPKGINGKAKRHPEKTEPHHANHDNTVIDIRTVKK